MPGTKIKVGRESHSQKLFSCLHMHAMTHNSQPPIYVSSSPYTNTHINDDDDEMIMMDDGGGSDRF